MSSCDNKSGNVPSRQSDALEKWLSQGGTKDEFYAKMREAETYEKLGLDNPLSEGHYEALGLDAPDF